MLFKPSISPLASSGLSCDVEMTHEYDMMTKYTTPMETPHLFSFVSTSFVISLIMRICTASFISCMCSVLYRIKRLLNVPRLGDLAYDFWFLVFNSSLSSMVFGVRGGDFVGDCFFKVLDINVVTG
jgi:hypothetical protein